MKNIIKLVVGIAAVIIGIFILVTYFSDKAKQTEETVAKVIRVDSELQTDSDGLDTRYYYPVLEYIVDDIKYENRLPDSGSTNSTEYKVGDSIDINFNPNNPNEFSKKGSIGGLIGGIFFIIVGIIAVLSIFFMP